MFFFKSWQNFVYQIELLFGGIFFRNTLHSDKESFPPTNFWKSFKMFVCGGEEVIFEPKRYVADFPTYWAVALFDHKKTQTLICLLKSLTILPKRGQRCPDKYCLIFFQTFFCFGGARPALWKGCKTKVNLRGCPHHTQLWKSLYGKSSPNAADQFHDSG